VLALQSRRPARDSVICIICDSLIYLVGASATAACTGIVSLYFLRQFDLPGLVIQRGSLHRDGFIRIICYSLICLGWRSAKRLAPRRFHLFYLRRLDPAGLCFS